LNASREKKKRLRPHATVATFSGASCTPCRAARRGAAGFARDQVHTTARIIRPITGP
jgi:hypothetical protein